MPTQQPTQTPSKPTDEQGMDWSSPQQQPTTPGGSGSGKGHESRVSPAGGVSTGAPALPGAPPVPGDLDPEVTRSRLAEFLHRHTAYELIPESAKVVVLDTALPVQQVTALPIQQSGRRASRLHETKQLPKPTEQIAPGLKPLLEPLGPPHRSYGAPSARLSFSQPVSPTWLDQGSGIHAENGTIDRGKFSWAEK
jgi:hypothetical protein